MNKKELRASMKRARASLGKAARREAAEQCLAKLRDLPEFRESLWVYAYMSYNSELATDEIITWCLANEKRVAVPKVKGCEMSFYEITALADCESGAYGILEPISAGKRIVTEPGFMLVPGLAFDEAGNRLGYGGGFYDRYLASHANLYAAALGYACQLVEAVPAEAHDRKMDIVIYG